MVKINDSLEKSEKLLNDSGYEVYSVSVGPISSNIDRAIESFYQIKGGQLDYGKARADSLGIIQKPEGKSYMGLYPAWNSKKTVKFQRKKSQIN